jgi:hypothetical protein
MAEMLSPGRSAKPRPGAVQITKACVLGRERPLLHLAAADVAAADKADDHHCQVDSRALINSNEA